MIQQRTYVKTIKLYIIVSEEFGFLVFFLKRYFGVTKFVTIKILVPKNKPKYDGVVFY